MKTGDLIIEYREYGSDTVEDIGVVLFPRNESGFTPEEQHWWVHWFITQCELSISDLYMKNQSKYSLIKI